MGRLAMGVAALAVVSSLWVGLCSGATIYIKPDGTGDVPTIAAGLAAAGVGDTLMLASGTFTGPGNQDLTIPDKNLKIVSETGNPDDCVIDFAGTYGFLFENGTAMIKGLTLTNAIWSALRVWTYMSDGYVTLWVRNCTFSNCEGDGAAINIACYGEIDITGCRFLSNTGGQWGAVAIQALAYLDTWMDACTFCGNSGEWGGAISCVALEGPVSVRNSIFCHNLATQGGGAIGLIEWCPEIFACTFFGNSAPLGSALAGGYWPGVVNCILAYGRGGPAFYVDEACPDCDPGAFCSNIYGNEGGDWVGLIADDLGQNGNFSAPPGFCYWETAPYDLHLCSGSPCLPGNHPDEVDCGLIGALGQGCDCGPTRTAPATWGAIKAMYR